MSIVDVDRAVLRGSIRVPGRTRWTVFDPTTDAFFVNIADPPSVVRIDGADPTAIAATIAIEAAGPHGLLDPSLRQLYVAIGDPGVIEVFDVDRLERVEAVATERGAHTIALDPDRHRIYAFLPETHRAAVFVAS